MSEHCHNGKPHEPHRFYVGGFKPGYECPGVPAHDGEERLRAVFEAVRSAWERDGSHLSVARAAIAALEARPREESPK